MGVDLQEAARIALMVRDPGAKVDAVRRFSQAFIAGEINLEHPVEAEETPVPGRPEHPPLVAPSQLARRGLGSPAGRAALLHAVAHIEFNAINLALDAVYRFGGMPAAFYADWVSVAVDEARHFELLTNRLPDLGLVYGDLPAHNGLWEMALKTAGNCLARMALVPRVLEARGLDVSPGMIERLERAGDSESAGLLRIILDEEVRHVAIGTRWFEYLCTLQGRESESTFLDLVAAAGSRIQPPINRPARLRAGFSEDELDALLAMPPVAVARH